MSASPVNREVPDPEESKSRRQDERAEGSHDLSWTLFETLLDAGFWPIDEMQGRAPFRKPERRARHRRR